MVNIFKVNLWRLASDIFNSCMVANHAHLILIHIFIQKIKFTQEAPKITAI